MKRAKSNLTSPRQPAPSTTDEAERRHFVFATILVMSCMLALPIAGATYIILIRTGWIASPW